MFLWLYAKYFYQVAVVDNLSTEWPGILSDRLEYSSQSVSTAFYMADKALVDAVVRLRNLYEEADKEPFPIREDAYPRIRPEQVANGEVVYGLSMFCDTEEGRSNKAIHRLHQAWE